MDVEDIFQHLKESGCIRELVAELREQRESDRRAARRAVRKERQEIKRRIRSQKKKWEMVQEELQIARKRKMRSQRKTRKLYRRKMKKAKDRHWLKFRELKYKFVFCTRVIMRPPILCVSPGINRISCATTDIHLTCLFQPMNLFPLLSGYTVGVLSYLIDEPTTISITSLFVLAIILLESLSLCFIRKHQSLAVIDQKHVLPNWFLAFLYSIAVVAPIVAGACFPIFQMSKAEEWKFLMDVWNCSATYPEYVESYKTLPNFVIYLRSPGIIVYFGYLLAGGLLIAVLFIVFIVDIFLIMNVLKTKMSKTSLRKHEDAIRSLQVQFVTSVICIIPPGFVVFIVILELGTAQLLTEIAIAWYGLHSAMNSISMMFLFPLYRMFLKELFKNITNALIFDKEYVEKRTFTVPIVVELPERLSIFKSLPNFSLTTKFSEMNYLLLFLITGAVSSLLILNN
ncbi:hypothetical protein CRE_09117 [Caenorhabditis remanei]|uniref:Uncharacterized protein n=1 Tax=Caenorhabditis remanei TaxID=31234 RepID=E3LJD5_CAERE|nr:hypothetical protein CRE_09117 [Caenorhabditis remanei]